MFCRRSRPRNSRRHLGRIVRGRKCLDPFPSYDIQSGPQARRLDYTKWIANHGSGTPYQICDTRESDRSRVDERMGYISSSWGPSESSKRPRGSLDLTYQRHETTIQIITSDVFASMKRGVEVVPDSLAKECPLAELQLSSFAQLSLRNPDGRGREVPRPFCLSGH